MLPNAAGAISKDFNKGASRCNVIKWVWPICSDDYTLTDGNMMI